MSDDKPLDEKDLEKLAEEDMGVNIKIEEENNGSRKKK